MRAPWMPRCARPTSAPSWWKTPGRRTCTPRSASFWIMLGPDDTALFFYAGHGVQIANENFLVPVDFVPGNSIWPAPNSVACPWPRSSKNSSANAPRRTSSFWMPAGVIRWPRSTRWKRGLAQPQNPGKETFIAFSTGPGQVAADNPDGRNSWFTEALSDYVGAARADHRNQ